MALVHEHEDNRGGDHAEETQLSKRYLLELLGKHRIGLGGPCPNAGVDQPIAEHGHVAEELDQPGGGLARAVEASQHQ